MNKIIMLAKGNIRKTKGQMLILAMLFLIASTLLIIGLSVITGFNAHFDGLREELNASDAHFNMARAFFTPEVEELFHQYATDMEIHSGVALNSVELTWGDDIFNTGLILYSIEDTRRLSQWKLVGEYLPLTECSVYVPYMLHFSAGYNLGDVISFVSEGHTMEFTVTGFVENIWVADMGVSPRFYVPPARLNELYDTFPHFIGTFVYANGIQNVQNFINTLILAIDAQEMGFSPQYWANILLIEEIIGSRTGTAFMMSALMVAFTLIIGAVSILVIRFRIKNSIDEDMPKIGSLMSVGYTSRQVIASIVAQYASIVFMSVVIGILPAFVLLPLVGRMFGTLSGMYWQPGFMPVPVVITVVSLTIAVLIFTIISARGIKKIAPVLALRGGVTTHSFKRNPFRLDKSPLPVNVSLALKSVLQGFRKSTMMFFILLSVSFTAIVALVIFYNASVDITAFEQLPGIERFNSVLIFTDDQDNTQFQQEVNAHPNVRDTQFFRNNPSTVNGEFSILFAMDDYSRRVVQNVFSGIFPRYANEVALTVLLAEELDVAVGDLVYMGAADMPFLVTGLVSGMEVGLFGAYVTMDGFISMHPTLSRVMLGVYLNPGIDAVTFAQEMEVRFEDYIILTMDFDEQFAHGVAAVADVMSLVGVIIIIIAAFVVILVLYFVISSTIVRKHRDLGIQKAIGYTTVGLMNQISLAFAFPIILGVLAGAILGAMAVNPLMAMGLRGMGVMQANFIINMVWVVSAGAVITALAYTMCMLVTWRIRKISAYELVTE